MVISGVIEPMWLPEIQSRASWSYKKFFGCPGELIVGADAYNASGKPNYALEYIQNSFRRTSSKSSGGLIVRTYKYSSKYGSVRFINVFEQVVVP